MQGNVFNVNFLCPVRVNYAVRIFSIFVEHLAK